MTKNKIEVTIKKFYELGGKSKLKPIYKVTRICSIEGTSDTKLFHDLKKAKKQVKYWKIK